MTVRWWACAAVLWAGVGQAAEPKPWAVASCELPPVTSYTWQTEKVDPRKPTPQVRAGAYTLRPEQVGDDGLDLVVTRSDPEDAGIPAAVRAAVQAAEADGTLVEPPLQLRAAGAAEVSIRNLDVWVAYMDDLADVMLPAMFPPDAPAEAMQGTRQLLTAPPMVQGLLLREVAPSVSMWCSMMERPVARYTTSRPNPLGGEPLRVEGTTRYRRKGDLLTSRTTETVQFDLSTMLAGLAAGPTPDPAQRAALLAQLQQVAFDRTAEHVVDLSTGLTVRYELVDVAELDGAGEVRNTVRIEQVATP